MFCPSCRSEYRAGVERCPTCEVFLVQSLDDAAGGAAPHARAQDHAPDPDLAHAIAVVGFLSLDEARGARRVLRDAGIASEILIRESDDPAAADGEECWIRVAPKHYRAAVALLGEEPEVESAPEAEGTLCSACHGPVSEDAVECPHCGARFE